MTNTLHTYRVPFTATDLMDCAAMVDTNSGVIVGVTQTLKREPAHYGETDVEYLVIILGTDELHAIASLTYYPMEG